ncbi:hypothetical protein S225a_24460 [Candidatus Brocadiaceae bacterium S225]|uniref:Uncharacterized protein n=1 Tax=Candidatus Scalindua brodae TaxID=237368 RepID=A0A0B0EQA6_9BACT|nr:MAG: hypothetical protein SCABRO_00194 [Candidatus Scalindua brodae]TWU30789.1 hypothetical protein S225a_24460 [Candidatus Brocadiaceae bacterium S225]
MAEFNSEELSFEKMVYILGIETQIEVKGGRLRFKCFTISPSQTGQEIAP